MISAIGIATVDHIMVINGFHAEEGTYHASAYRVEGGGMSATALCTASKLGSSTRLFTRIGDDINGRFIVDGLESFNVDTSCLITVPGENSFVSLIFVDANTGEKQFYSDRKHPLFGTHIDFDTACLEGTEVLLVDGFWMEAAVEGARWAVQRDIPVVGDFKGWYDDLDGLLPYVTHLVIPEFFARELTGKDAVPDMLRGLSSFCPGIPVITSGNSGGAYLCRGDVRSYPVFPVDAVDTTGAGDAFHGAFCHFLAAGYGIDRCLELASAVGAMNCRTIGGRSGIPAPAELSGFLAEHESDWHEGRRER